MANEDKSNNEIIAKERMIFQNLNSLAKDIESDIIKFFDQIELCQDRRVIGFGNSLYGDTETSYTYWRIKRPDSQLSNILDNLYNKYLDWYYQAEILVHEYNNSNHSYFEALFKNNKTFSDPKNCLLDFFNLAVTFTNEETPYHIRQEVLRLFKTQQSILNAISEIIPFVWDKWDKVISKHNPIPQNNNTNQTGVNIYNIQNQSLSIIHEEKNFHKTVNKIRNLIEQSDMESIKKEKLISNINNMEKTKGTSDYLAYYKEFMSFVANHATLLTTLAPYIKSILP